MRIVQSHAGSGLCSAKEAIEEPMAPIEDEPPLMGAVTRAAPVTCTFQRRYSWRGFQRRAQKRCDSMSDKPEINIGRLPNKEPIQFPMNAREVYMACAQQFSILNFIYVSSSIDGAGGSRSFSHADFVVRDLRAADRSQAEAAQVSAVVKVVDISDLPLERGDTWESISADKDKLKRVEPLLQQVAPFHNPSIMTIDVVECEQAWAWVSFLNCKPMCGIMQAFELAVEDEVAFAAITSYKVTLFIMRSMNIRKKDIYVSDPVWHDDTGPSARASWYSFMYESEQRHSGAISCSPVLTAEEQLLTFD